MCFILITLNDQGKATSAPELIKLKEITNPDGTGILTPHDSKINRALEASAEAILRTRHAKMTIAHMRMATTGNVSQQNVHLWKKKGAYFAHNGIVSKYSRYGVAKFGKKEENEPTDSYVFFETITGYISEDEVDTESISLEAADANLSGRFCITLKNKTYLFGDWDVTAHEGITYITSAAINLSSTQWQHNIPFSSKIPAWEADLNGVYVIDHETLEVTYLHENAKKTYTKPVATGSVLGFTKKELEDEENYYLYGGQPIDIIGARSRSRFND